MVRKTRKAKAGYKRITAFIPKTLRATKAVGNKAVRNIQYFLNKGVKSATDVAKAFDKRTAKTLRSLTRRRVRK